jgi:peptide-methionine (S)-S-oxide reductase
MLFNLRKKLEIPRPQDALPGRDAEMPVPERHAVLKTPMRPPFPEGMERVVLGLGCFWGAERKFWQTDGVFTTAVGYAAGHTRNPSYEEVCSGMTGHNEVVLVVFDPKRVGFEKILGVFWESHNPTQGMRQGNDIGTQYRSGIYTHGADQQRMAEASRAAYGSALKAKGFEAITTEIQPAGDFFYAEPYHQQYLAKNPNGYCGLGGTGVACPTGLAVASG